MQRLVIEGRLPGLNEYTAANRTNLYKGAAMKRKAENVVREAIKACDLHEAKVPVFLEYTWWEKDNRRDQDNVAFAQKFIQDALVEEGILKDDSRKYITGAKHSVKTDKSHPRIEVTINERDEDWKNL